MWFCLNEAWERGSLQKKTKRTNSTIVHPVGRKTGRSPMSVHPVGDAGLEAPGACGRALLLVWRSAQMPKEAAAILQSRVAVKPVLHGPIPLLRLCFLMMSNIIRTVVAWSHLSHIILETFPCHGLNICCCCSITQSYLTPSHPMDCSTQASLSCSVAWSLLTHVNWVGDALLLSYPLVPFSSCPQSFPTSGSFPMSSLFTSDGQSTGASASALVLPMNIQGWLPYWVTESSSSLQSLSPVWLFVISWTTALQASLSITNSWSLLKLMLIELMMPSNHLILCCPFLLLPSIFPSIRVFSNESVLSIMWPKYWSFSFHISPSNEYAGLISFKIDWFDLLAVQGTLKSLLQHHSSKASSALSLLYSPTLTSICDYWKNHSFD